MMNSSHYRNEGRPLAFSVVNTGSPKWRITNRPNKDKGMILIDTFSKCHPPTPPHSIVSMIRCHAKWRKIWQIQLEIVWRFGFLLGAFAKLRKATNSFFMSVRPHGVIRFPLDEFSWNLIFDYFLKIGRAKLSLIKSDKNKMYFA